jgi:hypothetical protein
MNTEMITISKQEYLQLKEQAEIDLDFLKELIESLADIKAGRVKRVR